MKKTLLIVGDEVDYESFKKVRRNTNKDKIFNYLSIDYKTLFSKKLPEIESEEIIIYLFFPFDYWDKYIEPKNYKGVYGSGKFFNRFKSACKKIEKILNNKYKDKIIHYIIPANMMYQDRDKELTKDLLKK